MRSGELVAERFLVERFEGSGGMGAVYKAVDEQTGRPVAVKVLASKQKDAAARFGREARILADLDHPGIVGYVAHGVLSAGEPYLAMEWLDGEDLHARLDRGRLGAGESVSIALQIACALGFAHARGIVHRDLKPSNIFLADLRLDSVRLLDFGIAQLAAVSRMTRTGSVIGTLGYMAPEQVQGVERLDPRADVFSLGCVLFECLTGEPAFPGAHANAILAKILFDDPPSIREKRPELPEALGALVDQMLSKNAEGRPRDGEAVAVVLRELEHLQLLPVTESAPRAGLRQEVLTGSEQRAVAVILIGPPSVEPTVAGAAPIDSGTAEERLRQEAELHGGHFGLLVDGSIAVMIAGTAVAKDLAAKAARCALTLRKHASDRPFALAMGRGQTTGDRLPMGPAIDRAAGVIHRKTPVGSNVELACVLLDEVTAGLLDARFDVRENAGGYALHGERELAEGTRTLLGKATPCVGRDSELRLLEQIFEECVEEPAARAVLVTAPPGTGKSRLAQELLRVIRSRGEPVSVWIGRGDPVRAGSAFSMLSQILRGACGIQDSEPLSVRREKLFARVAARVGAGTRQGVAEFIGEIAGTPFPDEDSLPLRAARKDAQLMNERMRAAFLEFLGAECEAHPVLLVLEDLHWGDWPTVQFVGSALRDRERPLFVFALARPEVQETFPKLWGRLQEIKLKELGKKASERLVRHVLGAGVERDVMDRLVQLSEGNAFYLEELIRATAEGKGGSLPETVVAMVHSRLGALDDGSRRVLRAASIFGEVFWTGAIASLLGVDGRATRPRGRFEDLVDQEVVIHRKESRFTGEDEYAFRHALLREGAYAMLTDEDRALGHRLAGEWLEQHGEQDALTLAEHFERGGDGARAGHYYLRAAEKASSGSDSMAAIARAKRGLACDIPETLRIRVLGKLCEAHYFNIELLGDALPYADEVLRFADRGSAPWCQAMLVKHICTIQAGHIEEFLAIRGILEESWPAPDAGGSWTLCVSTLILLLDTLGRSREVNTLIGNLTAVVRDMGERVPTASALFHAILAVRTAYAEEDPAKALEHAEGLSEVAAAMGHPTYLAGGQIVIVMNRWYLGAFFGDTERILMAATIPDEEIGMISSFRPFILAWLFADRGALDEARLWAGRLVEAGRARRLPVDEGRGHWVLAEVLRRAGELEAADVEIQAATTPLGMASPLDMPGVMATFAALRLAQGRPLDALAAAEDGLSRYASMGACGYFRGAFLRLVHAECLEATGNHHVAKAAIARAKERLFAIADKIADPGYRKSFLENVPENRKTLDLAKQWLEPA